MEREWPQIADAFRIPNRDFQLRRQFLFDLDKDEVWWATEDGQKIIAARDAMVKLEREVRFGV